MQQQWQRDGYNGEEEEGEDGIRREAGQCSIDALLRRAARNVMAAKWEKEAADGDEAATAGKEEAGNEETRRELPKDGGKEGAEDKTAPPPLPPPPPTPPPTGLPGRREEREGRREREQTGGRDADRGCQRRR